MSKDLATSLVYVVDDDADLGASVARMLQRERIAAESFEDPEQLLEVYAEAPAACVITDVMMGRLDGFAFAERLRSMDPATAIIFMTAWPTTSSAVDAVRNYGGLDYLEKPLDQNRLLGAVREGLAWSQARREQLAKTRLLTPRERNVFGLLVRGFSTKAIASKLELSPRTIEDHRARIFFKTETKSVSQLIALATE